MYQQDNPCAVDGWIRYLKTLVPGHYILRQLGCSWPWNTNNNENVQPHFDCERRQSNTRTLRTFWLIYRLNYAMITSKHCFAGVSGYIAHDFNISLAYS